MWNYLKEDTVSTEKSKEYTSFPEPNGKPETSGLSYFEKLYPRKQPFSLFHF